MCEASLNLRIMSAVLAWIWQLPPTSSPSAEPIRKAPILWVTAKLLYMHHPGDQNMRAVLGSVSFML